MSNFSEYIKSSGSEKQSCDNQQSESKKNYTQDDLQGMIDKYSNYDRDSLMSEFLKLTLEKKKKGELKSSELETLKNTLSPMLSSEQKSSLNQILEMVKNVE